MLDKSWLEYIAECERQIKQTPTPTRRRQPKVTRHMSGRQRAALSQTKNPVRAAYVEDTVKTPTKPVEWKGIRPNLTNWSTGKSTTTRNPKE